MKQLELELWDNGLVQGSITFDKKVKGIKRIIVMMNTTEDISKYKSIGGRIGVILYECKAYDKGESYCLYLANKCSLGDLLAIYDVELSESSINLLFQLSKKIPDIY